MCNCHPITKEKLCFLDIFDGSNGIPGYALASSGAHLHSFKRSTIGKCKQNAFRIWNGFLMKKLIDVKEFLKKTLKPSLDIPPPHLSCYRKKEKEYTTIVGQEICRNAAMKRKMVVALSNPQWERFLFEVSFSWFFMTSALVNQKSAFLNLIWWEFHGKT